MTPVIKAMSPGPVFALADDLILEKVVPKGGSKTVGGKKRAPKA